MSRTPVRDRFKGVGSIYDRRNNPFYPSNRVSKNILVDKWFPLALSRAVILPNPKPPTCTKQIPPHLLHPRPQTSNPDLRPQTQCSRWFIYQLDKFSCMRHTPYLGQERSTFKSSTFKASTGQRPSLPRDLGAASTNSLRSPSAVLPRLHPCLPSYLPASLSRCVAKDPVASQDAWH